LRGSEFLALFPAATAGTLASFWPRLSVALPLFGFLVLGSAPYWKPVIDPLDESALTDRWQGDACLQSTASTCGPACVATLLKHAGVSTTERAVARACHTSASGTEAWYLARYVRAAPAEHGMFAGFFVRPGFSPELGLPAMIGIQLRGGAGHFLAVLENKDGVVTFVDPLVGEERVPLDEFRKRFDFTGFHMYVIKD
jgi:ABC-type bacteriocin/lantibiotic exporter with double-glycine peptidase domain